MQRRVEAAGAQKANPGNIKSLNGSSGSHVGSVHFRGVPTFPVLLKLTVTEQKASFPLQLMPDNLTGPCVAEKKYPPPPASEREEIPVQNTSSEQAVALVAERSREIWPELPIVRSESATVSYIRQVEAWHTSSRAQRSLV
jgi:hypothetical protein